MQRIAEDFQSTEGGEVDTGIFQRVWRAIFLELLCLLGGKADALDFQRVKRFASAGVDVQQIDPVLGRASSEDSPGDTEEFQVGAGGDDRKNVAISFGRVESVKPQTADVL